MSIAAPGNSTANPQDGDGADDFIPAPADGGAQSAPTPTTNVTVQPDSSEPIGPLVTIESGVGQTGLILAAAALLILGGLLLLLRNSIRRSLIASRASLDSANTASWTWYFVLLAVGILVIVGVTTGMLVTALFAGATIAVAVIGCLIAMAMSSRAKQGK
jgi:hypothetical protein